MPAELERRWQGADEQLFSKIRASLGLDECEWFAVGAAPTPPEVILFFDAIGIEIAELWGMSETSAVVDAQPARADPRRHRGPAAAGRRAEAGRRRRDPPARADDHEGLPQHAREDRRDDHDDGWLLTGDIGEIDADGYLKIVDRKKELIINAAGKNMSPANIEAKIKAACPLVAQVVAIGDRRPYNVALVTLDPDAVRRFRREARAGRRVAGGDGAPGGRPRIRRGRRRGRQRRSCRASSRSRSSS